MSTAIIPFVLRVGRSNPQARLLSFFLGFSTCFIWLAIAVEGLFYAAFSLTLYLWVEVETVLHTHRSHSKGATSQREIALDASTYRPKADDLRIAVFFLFFVQVGFFGTGK